MNIAKSFGSLVFNDTIMKEYLPKDIYNSLKHTAQLGTPLNQNIAAEVAKGMMKWAISKGATHYTHWFQPMTNITAGKLDSFIEPSKHGVTLEFDSKALVKGEPDASSFPSGGLRATFEARGYTTWDPTSPAFVRDQTLYIPTAFCAYTGEALDTKTPLLRSMEALNKQALRFIQILGNKTSKRITPTVGAEQEYFLIDRELYEKRLDLKICGCTLVGAKPPKGQELDDHYCGRIRLRVSDFMKDLDSKLWELGVMAKTKHNEAAPAQHELAPIFASLNIACDHNQLTMEMMRSVAKRHGLACLLHEKPFAGVNGSGKHNNYSLCTDDGINLLSPKEKFFLPILCAFIEAVDRHSDLLRLSAACAGNDSRLGECEAPPAIISVSLGEQLTRKLKATCNGVVLSEQELEYINKDVLTLPDVQKDDSDRNRTSPFAFTGNKFEFRMLGSSQSIAMTNIVLNSALAEVFENYSEKLEQCVTPQEIEAQSKKIMADTIKNHGRVVFNGNNYSEQWVQRATRRGLANVKTSLEAFAALTVQKNIDLFQKHEVFTPLECNARYEIMVENYHKVLSIEASTMNHMVGRQILPGLIKYTGKVAISYNALIKAGVNNEVLKSHLDELSELISKIMNVSRELETTKEIRPTMSELRKYCDRAESIMDKKYYDMPTYSDLLYRI